MANNDDWLREKLNRPERDAELMAKGEEIKLFPLAGWTTATLPENNVFVGLEILIGPPPAGIRILRVAMTRAQCAELAKTLERLARAPHRPPGSRSDA